MDQATYRLLGEMEAALRVQPPMVNDALVALYRAAQEDDPARWATWLRNARLERERAAGQATKAGQS